MKDNRLNPDLMTTPIKTFLGGFVAAIIGIVIDNVLRRKCW